MSMACMWFDEDEVIELDEAVEFAIDNAELTEKKQGIFNRLHARFDDARGKLGKD